MNSKNKIFCRIILLIICFLMLLNAKVFAIVKATSNFYVNDYANLLDAETENYIMTVNQSLNSKTKAQVVVVTVKNLEGKSIEEYATELFRSFGIGDKNLNNGVLMLIALEERKSRIEVGYGLEGILNDAKTGRIQDEYMIPYLRQNNWDEGIKNGFNAIINEIEKEYGVSVGSETATIVEGEGTPKEIIFIFVSYIISMIILFATNEKKNKIRIISIYFILIIILSFIITKDMIFRSIIIITNFFTLFPALGLGGSGGSGRRTDSMAVAVFLQEADFLVAVVAQEEAEAQEVFKNSYIIIDFLEKTLYYI